MFLYFWSEASVTHSTGDAHSSGTPGLIYFLELASNVVFSIFLFIDFWLIRFFRIYLYIFVLGMWFILVSTCMRCLTVNFLFYLSDSRIIIWYLRERTVNIIYHTASNEIYQTLSRLSSQTILKSLLTVVNIFSWTIFCQILCRSGLPTSVIFVVGCE